MSGQIRRRPSANETPRPTLRYGDRVGSYIITGFAGTGATSFVYRARREDSFDSVAIKVLHPHLITDPVKRRRFIQEAEMMMRLKHSNIVRFHEIIELGEQLAFVMDFIEGETLEEWFEEAANVDETTLACVFVDVLRGLGQAHRKGIIHRDLKPANLMITFQDERYVAKIIDFGVARFTNEPLAKEDKSKIVGTAAYISPEEVRDPELVCEASDIYSVGVMMYEAACGQRPFEGMPVRDLMHAHVHDMPSPPREINPSLTPELEMVILRAMSKTVATRFDSTNEVIGALEGAIRAAMMGAAIAEQTEAAATQEWTRPEGLEGEAQPLMVLLQQYFLFAMSLMMTTGMRGDSSDPHYLNRVDNQNLPFY